MEKGCSWYSRCEDWRSCPAGGWRDGAKDRSPSEVLLLGKGRLPGRSQSRALQDRTVVATWVQGATVKAVGQEAAVGSLSCCQWIARGLGCSVGIGQQGPRVLPRRRPTSRHGGSAEAQEGLAARGTQSFQRLCQGQLRAVEGCLEGRGGWEAGGAARGRPCRPAASQEGLRGLGAVVSTHWCSAEEGLFKGQTRRDNDISERIRVG